MSDQRFDRLIQNRINKSIDLVLPAGAIISWLSALAIYYSTIPYIYSIVDALVGVILMGIFFARNKLRPGSKIFSIITIPIFIGVFAFLDGGFGSGLIILLMLSNTAAVLFVSKKGSSIIGIITILVMLVLWGWTSVAKAQIVSPPNSFIWTIQLLLTLLYLIVVKIGVYSIKNYLIENIEDLEASSILTRRMAYYDELTGLPNYNYLMETLNQKFQDNAVRGAIIMFSLKNLNVINAIYGNEMGNKVLALLGQALIETRREDDIVARVGGNEFAYWINLIPEKEDVVRLKNEVIHSLFNDFPWEGIKDQMEYNAAYAVMESEQEGYEICYHKAQLALTFCKYNKAQDILAYDKSFDDYLKRRTTLKDQLKQDLTMGKNLRLYYQKQIHAETKEVIGVEALSRWSTTEYGDIAPYEFIPLIENLNMHALFGQFVLKRAMEDHPKLEEKFGNPITISVNISPAFLMVDSFTKTVINIIEECAFPPEKLILEITEELVIEGVEKINTKLMPLRKMGVKISLDDFGTGYSSLSYLAKFDVDELKLDKVLIDQLLENEKSRILILKVIELSKMYHIRIVGEGVEVLEQYDSLLNMGCQIIQGFYFGKPEPLEDKINIRE